MKIMYCITSASWGGAQLHVLELCRYEINNGNEVVFIVGNEGPLTEKVRQVKGVKVIVLNSLHRELNIFFDMKAIFDLRKLIIKEKPDIVHLHSSKAGTIGRLASMKLATKVVFTVHGWAFTEGISSKLKKNIYRLVEKAMAPLADLIICVSEYDLKIGKKYKVLSNKNNAIVVHNGVPEVRESKIRNRKVLEPRRIVMTARFSNQKDQKTLIQALSILKNQNYVMTFVGDGGTLESNKKLAAELNLTERIKFLGFKDDVTPFLAENDIYVLSTHYEGLPISIIEAMSYGLPIIATDVGGNSELVINEQNGYLVKNENELSEALNELVNSEEQCIKFGKNSFKFYKEKFRLEDCMQKIQSAYLEI